MLGFKLFGSGLNTLNVASIVQDVGTAIVAAGTTQGTATLLTNALNYLGTVAANTGVIIYPGTTSGITPSAGDWQIVYNGGANAVNVYPPSGAKINVLSANAPHVLSPNACCQYWTVSATQIVGVLSA